MMMMLPSFGRQCSRGKFLTRSFLSTRRSVWHAGYENAKEAEQIAQRLRKLLKDTPSEKKATKSTEDEVQALRVQYEKITGESFDDSTEG
jgi:hypothetical protein